MTGQFEHLAAPSQKVQFQRQSVPLFDTVLFSRYLEDVLEGMAIAPD